MNILMYLYYPMYNEHLAGGVQVWIKNLIKKIEKLDNNIHIKVVCIDGNKYPFAEGIDIDHTLVDMECDFLKPKDIYNNFRVLKKYEKDTDLIWMIDRNFPISSLKPKLLSLNTICYERELMSIFQSGWNKMVVLTDFVKNQVIDYVNKENVYQIPCYVDPIFINVKENYLILKKYFNYDNKKKYILFPHRPDLEKGHYEAVDLIKKLVKYDNSYRLLIPNPPIAKEINIKREQENIDKIKEYVDKNGLNEYVIFHKWVDYDDIPMYYKIGEFTLFLSKLPETFGLTLLNSISVGTPVISYGVGALSEVVPPGNAHQVVKNIDDMEKVILKGKKHYNVVKDKNYVLNKYNFDKIANQYINLFYDLKRGE